MLILVTFALAAEFAAWRKLRAFQPSTGADGVPTFETTLDKARLRVVLTGIGPRAASAAIVTALRDRPDCCISSGLAGGLRESLQVADVVAANAVRDEEGSRIESDRTLLALATRQGARAVDLYSSPVVILRAEAKRRFSTIAGAVDMESAAILNECRRAGVPSVVIRAISDPAHVDIALDFNQTLNDRGGLSTSRMLMAVAKKPSAVPGLIRLGLDGRKAGSALAVFLESYIQGLV